MPAPAFDRVGEQTFDYRLDHKVTGTGSLTMRWSDGLGRLVEERTLPLRLTGSERIPVTLDLRRAVTTVNKLLLTLSLDCPSRDCPGAHFHEETEVSFATVPPDQGWWDYQIIMWHPHNSEQYAALKDMGITAGMLFAKDKPLRLGGGVEGALLSQDLRWYDENIATDFFSAYHRFFPDKPVNWLYLEAKDMHRRDRESLIPFQRDPSLSDPSWRARIRDRLISVVTTHRAFHPLYYSLGDETGIADLAAYWDFDYSSWSLSAFRRWLEKRYGAIARLNDQWETHFGGWDDVMPLTAVQAIRGGRDNFSAWADFREWMDISFSDALADARDAVHAADPAALAAIEGGQVPGWGGYDYSLLADAVDAFEIYDIGNSIEIVRSFRPDAPILTTSAGAGPKETLNIWRELLHGTRGLILWDEKAEFADRYGTTGHWGREAAPTFTELRDGIAALLISSRPAPSSVALHYSPASFRIGWILDQQRKGGGGLDAAAMAGHPDDAFTLLRKSLCDLLTDLGVPYRFLSSRQIESAALTSGDNRLLVLPRSIALSAAEVAAIHAFVEKGGRILAAGEPGSFDEHGRKRSQPMLADLFSPMVGKTRAQGAMFDEAVSLYDSQPGFKKRVLRRKMMDLLQQAGVAPAFDLIDPHSGAAVSGVEMTVLSNGAVSLLGLLNTAAESAKESQSRPLVLNLPASTFVYDLRTGRQLGEKRQVEVSLPAVEPVLLALSKKPIPDFSVEAPLALRQGDIASIKIARAEPSPDAVQIFHIDLRGPDGRVRRHYSGNLRATDGAVTKILPLALDDSPGSWTISVRDAMTGYHHDMPFTVGER